MMVGEMAALLAALLWTISSLMWGRIHLSAVTLNWCKSTFGLMLIGLHLLLLMAITGRPMFAASWQSWGWLAVSGVLGILIGDGLYFRSLQILGPRLSLMLMSLSPLFAALLGFVFLDESLSRAAIYGVVMTVGGVLSVVLDRKAKQESPGLIPGTVSSGIILGVLAALCQAGGGALARRGMRDPVTELPSCDPIEAAFIRILVAAIGTSIVLAMSGKFRIAWSKATSRDYLKMILPATAMGTWLGIWLSQIAFQETKVAIAQTLLSTCPLFAIPIVWGYLKQPVTMLSVLGTVVAISGIYLIVR